MSDIPSERWSLERLGEYCALSSKRMALDAWRFGRALNLARSKQSHGDWKEWKRRYVPYLTHSSENRYRQLAERVTEESLAGVGLTEAYRLLDLTGTARDAGRVSEEDEIGPDVLDDEAVDDQPVIAFPASFGELPESEPLASPPVEGIGLADDPADQPEGETGAWVLGCPQVAAGPAEPPPMGLPRLAASVREVEEQVAWLLENRDRWSEGNFREFLPQFERVRKQLGRICKVIREAPTETLS